MRAYNWKTRGGKSLRGLGETEINHTRWMSETADKASASAVSAANFAQDGSCTVAMKSLMSAHGWLGAAVAHSQSGGRGVALGPVTTTVSRADDAVFKFCKKSTVNTASKSVGDLDTPLGSIRTPYLVAIVMAVGFFLWSKK
jgi:hypothetical protein